MKSVLVVAVLLVTLLLASCNSGGGGGGGYLSQMRAGHGTNAVPSQVLLMQ